MPGEANPAAVLTEDDVRLIRKLYAEGHSQQKIADRFGVWQTNISAIIRRITWHDI